MKTIFKGKAKKYSCQLILVSIMCLTLSFGNLAYADEAEAEAEVVTIPDKSTFREYIVKFYGLNEDAANIDEKIDKAVADYKNRYTMYIDIDYVLGKTKGTSSEKSYYNGPTPNVDDTGGNLVISDDINEYMAAIGLSIGCNVNNLVYNSTIQYLPYMKKYGEMYGVDPYILVAIACQESSGNHQKYLRQNAGCGLMQIEKPGIEEGGTTKLSAKNVLTGAVDTMNITYEDMCDVELNIKAGAMIFASRYKECNGNLPVALQGYNYNSNAVNKTIQEYIEDTGSSETVQDIKNDSNNLKWLGYRIVTHQDPPRVGLTGFEGVCKIANCQYQGQIHPSGRKYGDPYYIERILSYYNSSATGSGGGAQFFQGAIPKEFTGSTYYGDTKYGKSTLKVAGAGPTALATVISRLSKYVTPAEVAALSSDYYVEDGGSTLNLLLDVEDYGLKVSAIGMDTNKLDKALKEGKIAIAITGSRDSGGVTGIFNRSSEGNFIVVFGYDDDGYLEVADPDGANYERIQDAKITLDVLKGETIGGFYVYEAAE